MSLPPAGWFPNPDPGGSGLRWWDGELWTEHYNHDQTPPPVTGAPGLLEQARAGVAETRARVDSASTKLAEVREAGVVSFAGAAARRKLAARKGAKATGLDRAPTVAEVLAQVTVEPPRFPLEEQVEVAGEHFYAKEIRRVFTERGLPITTSGATLEDLEAILLPEPWNPHDANAVAVVIGTHQVGHLPADLAASYAYPLGLLAHAGRLASGTARPWAKDDGSGIIRARCTVLIPEAEVFAR